jgi:ribonuclease HI
MSLPTLDLKTSPHPTQELCLKKRRAIPEQCKIIQKNPKEFVGLSGENIISEHVKEFSRQYECIGFSGEITQGPRESWYGEYMALYQAIKKLDAFPEIQLIISTDHLTLSNLFKLICMSSDKQLEKMNKINGLPILIAMRALERGRLHQTNQIWIKAHSGKFGNTIADELAGQYFHPLEDLPLIQHFECPKANTSPCTLTLLYDELTQLPIRACLKQIHLLRDQKEGQAHISKQALNDGNKPTSRKTDRQTHYTRALSFKMLAFILPSNPACAYGTQRCTRTHCVDCVNAKLKAISTSGHVAHFMLSEEGTKYSPTQEDCS